MEEKVRKTLSWKIVALAMLSALAGRATVISAVSSDPADSSLTISGSAVDYTLNFPSLTPITLTVTVNKSGSYGLNAVVLDNIKTRAAFRGPPSTCS